MRSAFNHYHVFLVVVFSCHVFSSWFHLNAKVVEEIIVSLKWPLLAFFQIMFQAYGDKQGPLHGMLINTPYVTKDLLQSKRFQAQSLGTTYVYDFPEMFRQVLYKNVPIIFSFCLDVLNNNILTCCLFYPIFRLWKSFGIHVRLLPTYLSVLFLLSCSPSQSWFLMLKVSWYRWIDCQGATRSVFKLEAWKQTLKSRNLWHWHFLTHSPLISECTHFLLLWCNKDGSIDK